ncbi:MAG: hypothetical protein ACFFG0_20870, partial [Candidatus Thorarchaeota archaeon]
MTKRNSSDRTTKNSVEGVTDMWLDFSDQMENKLRDLFESSAAEYRDIYQSWTELSEKMGKQMVGFTTGNETIYNNLYNSWKEYSEKLNTDLGIFGKSDDKTHTEFLDFWNDYSEKFTDQLSNVMYEGFKEQYELYEVWMDTFAKSALEGSKSGDIPSIMNKYWLEGLNRIYDTFSKVPLGPSGISGEGSAGEQIYKQFEEMHNYWTKISTKMLDEVMRSPAYGNFLAQSIQSSMDTQKMIENYWIKNFQTLGLPTKSELEEVRE